MGKCGLEKCIGECVSVAEAAVTELFLWVLDRAWHFQDLALLPGPKGGRLCLCLALPVCGRIALAPDSSKGSGSTEALIWVNVKVLISGALYLQVSVRVSLSVSVKLPAGVFVWDDEAGKNGQLGPTESPYPWTCT